MPRLAFRERSNIIRFGGVAMRRNYWVVVANAVCVVALAGCHDGSLVGPAATSASAPAPMSLAPEGHPTLDISAGLGNSTSIDFIVGPSGGTYYVGSNAVYFPAGAICDPDTSSYGEGTWDSSCRAATGNVQIHAEVRSQDGRTWVDFTPALRFVPSRNPHNWVFVLMSTPGAQGASASDLAQFNILYAQSIGGATQDDAASDSTMRTYVDVGTGTSIRRVKHFSGYTASAGFVCDPSAPDCGGEPTSAPPP